MLSPATRNSAIFLRTLPFPLHCRTPPRTAQPRFSNLRPLSTSREPLPSLEDLLKPRAKPKPDDAATTNTANTSRVRPPNPPKAQKNLFISGLPRGDAQELEQEIRAAFSPLGEAPSIRVGAHSDGRKYAHLEYGSSAAALEVLRIVKETPVSIAERTLSVNLAGKSSEEPARSTLFFTGFHGDQGALKRALRAQGYKSFQVYFFLGSRAEQSGDGRIDFPSRVDTHHAYSQLNGMKIDDGATLNISREPPGSPSPLPPPPTQPEPQPQPPAKTTLLVGNLPAQISETELGERVRGFFGRHAAIMSVELAVDDEGNSQRFCYVRFVHPDEALRASQSAAEEPMVLDGLKTTAVLIAQPVLHRILHVRGFRGSRQSLKEALKKYSGRIKKINFIHDRMTGRPTGNSLIEFKSKTGAVEALTELNGYETEGGKLKLTFYKPSPEGFKHRTVKGEADIASGLKPI